MIADSFSPRTIANMEVALERACSKLSIEREVHGARRFVAVRILECAESGDETLGGLTQAALSAACEFAIARQMAQRRSKARQRKAEAQTNEDKMKRLRAEGDGGAGEGRPALSVYWGC